MSELITEMNSPVHAAAAIFDTLAEDHKEDLFERQPIEYRQWVENSPKISENHLHNPYKSILADCPK